VTVEGLSRRDPLRYAPVFVLAPARSNSSVVTAMLGQHPELCAFPELALFRKQTVGELLTDPPGWKGPPAQQRMAGVYRALAEHHDRLQTSDTVSAAADWVEGRSGWNVAELLDHLLALAAPLVGIEKSPESSSRDEYLARLVTAYPRARYLHVTRHPRTSVASMHRAWAGKGHWEVAPGLFPDFCLGVWYFQHRRIHELVQSLPRERALRVRSEDVVNEPAAALPPVCRWLGIDSGPRAVEAMSHPEGSPYAVLGPAGAAGGWDAGFLAAPELRSAELPESLDLPDGWNADPWLGLASRELARRLGY
jgi:hypothetical protein